MDLALGGLLGVPDQIFGIVTQYTCLALIAAVGAIATVGAAVLRHRHVFTGRIRGGEATAR